MPEKSKPRKRSRGECRVLLALMTGATNLSGYPLAKAAQVGFGAVYVILGRLERAGLVDGKQALGLEFEPRPSLAGAPGEDGEELTAKQRAWKPNRRARRILLTLLTGATNLDALVLRRTARVGPLYFYRVLDRLEDMRWIQGDQNAPDGMGSRLRFYRLTTLGQIRVGKVLGLEVGSVQEHR